MQIMDVDGAIMKKVEWSPNHRPEFREMHFSIDVRDAFGRDDIQGVNLVMSTPNGATSVFDKTFTEGRFEIG